MPTDSELKIVISAIDNASAILKQIAASSTQTAEQMKAANESTVAGNEKTEGSFGSLTHSVLMAQIEYQALFDVYESVKGFFEGSIDASMKASATMAQVAVDVKNAGLSYTVISPQLEEVAQKNTKLGFSMEDTQLSMGKLILATGNYNDSLALNQLAMDLSRAKGIDLNSATVLLQQVMAGNTRVMKQYGISLDSATTSAEALNLLHEKLQGSASAFADTSAGKMAEVQAQWQAIQVTVGDQFMPLLSELFNMFEQNLPEIKQGIAVGTTVILDMIQAVKDLAGFASTLAPYFMDVFKVLEFIYPPLAVVVDTIKMLAPVVDAQRKASEAADQAAAVAQKLADKYQQLADAYNKVNKEQITAADLSSGDAKATDLLTKAKDALAASTTGAGNAFGNIENHINAANNAMIKHKDAVAKLTTEYDKMRDKGATDLADLADQFDQKMKTINDSIAKTQDAITNLTDSYNKAKTSDASSVADKIVASEQKIADLKKQILESTSQTQTDNLNEQLAKEQANYDSSLAYRNAHLTDIQAAETEAKKTDLQRTIDDYAAKRVLADKDYQDKLSDLNKQLAAQQTAATQEKDIYTKKVAAINGVLDTAQKYFNQLSAERVATTTKEVDAEIAQFNALAAAIGAMKTASQSALSTIKVPNIPGVSTSTQSHEAGGTVQGPRGTPVPIIAHGGEEVIPAEQVGSRGGSGISVVINNPVVRSSADLDAMRAMIDEVMRPLLTNAKIAHI